MPCQDAAYEVGLGVGVSLAIAREALGEAELQGGVVLSNIRVGPQQVAKRQLVFEARRVCRDEVQVVGSTAWVRLAEPVHLLASIGRVEIPQSSQGVEAGSGSFEAVDADEDVDDGPGG